MAHATGPPLAPGTIVHGRFEIIANLGAGGMARVYRARDHQLGREVALKILHSLAESPNLEQRFQREARNSAALDHAGCARVYDCGTDDSGGRFLVMEILRGPTLRDELSRQGRLSAARTLAVGRQLLAALAHAHARDVLHRDLKPENVMYRRPGGSLVLIDFGLSLLRDDAPLTAIGSCVGSPTYLAPERLLEQPYDARADLYAVGVILYELLAGRPPFGGNNPTAIGRMHIFEPAPHLHRLCRDAPPSLVAAIHRALEKDPKRRFASAHEFGACLDEVAEQMADFTAVGELEQAPIGSAELDFASGSPPRRSLLRRAMQRVREWRWRRYWWCSTLELSVPGIDSSER